MSVGKGHRRRDGKDIPVTDWANIFSTAYCFNCKKVTRTTVVTDGLNMTATCTLCNTTLNKEYSTPTWIKRTNDANYLDPTKFPDESTAPFKIRGIDTETKGSK